MRLRRRYVLIYIIVFSLSVLFVISKSYDDFSRNVSIDESNKELIEKYLSNDDTKMLIDDNIKTDKFIKFIKTPQFSLKNYEYYNILDKYTKLDKKEIVEYGNKLAEYEYTLGSLEKILSKKVYTVQQLISLASSPSPFYKDTLIEYYPNSSLALSNYKYYIRDYTPKHLVNINKKFTLDKTTIKLEKEAASQINLMCDAMKLVNDKECGGLKIQYGYISYEELMKNRTKYPSFIKPGHNDFQLGKTISFADQKTLTSSPMYLWLLENSYKFGYVQRYPDNKEKYTHVSNQPAVFRYVGVNNATTIYQQNKAVEEIHSKE